MQSDKAGRDIFWLMDESREDPDNLLVPEVLATEVVRSLETARVQSRSIYEELREKQAES